MKKLLHWASALSCLAIIVSCQDGNDNEPSPSVDTGFLEMGISINIEAVPTGRTEVVVDIDDYKVIIYNEGTEYLVFERFADMPQPLELPTGTYTIEVNSNNLVNAEFENPYYQGFSDPFNIDKEDSKTIIVEATLANCKVSFMYSQNVLDNFTSWEATATLINEGDGLSWPMGETREGYFILSPILLVVNLEYERVFDGELITRNFIGEIPEPQPATHYIVKVDAVLADGEITLIIEIDDSVEEVIIELGDGIKGPDINIPQGATWTNLDETNPGSGVNKWQLSNVLLADQTNVYYGMVNESIKASMDGGEPFSEQAPNEVLDFDPAQSDLPTGLVVFTGTTFVELPEGTNLVDTRFIFQVKDALDVGVALLDPTSVGLPEGIGGLLPIGSSADVFHIEFSFEADDPTLTPVQFEPFLGVFDRLPTPPDAGGSAATSFNTGFYWD